MELPKFTENLNIISSLPDRPAITPDELKKKFDESGNKIKYFLNNIFIKEMEDALAKEIKKIQDDWEKKIKSLEEKQEKNRPVGSIYISDDEENPADIFGYGKWTRIAKGMTLVGVDEEDEDFNTSGNTGGEKKHKLTLAEMPKHRHRYTKRDCYTAMIDPAAGGAGREPNSTESSAYTSYEGGDEAHNNMPPYYTVYIWKRIS